jgi:hypothetical protein
LREKGFAAFPEADPARMLSRVLAGLETEATPDRPLPGTRGPWAWLRWGSLAAAAAAALLLVAVLLQAPPPEEEPGIRQKGSLGLNVYLRRDGRVQEALTGEEFRAGDQLRFAIEAPAPGFALVVGLEPRGRLYPCYPLDPGAGAQPVPGGVSGPLPGAVELDESPGEERLFLIWCPRPFGPDELRPTGPAELAVPAECRATHFVLRKPSPGQMD